MYQLDLTHAYCPAQADTHYHECTIEQMLRAQAAESGTVLLVPRSRCSSVRAVPLDRTFSPPLAGAGALRAVDPSR